MKNEQNRLLNKYLWLSSELEIMQQGFVVQQRVANPSNFLYNLRYSANHNCYVLYDVSDPDPKVVIIGNCHQLGKKDTFFDEVAAILKSSLAKGDKVLLEGPANGKIIQGLSTMTSMSISTLEDVVTKKEIGVYFNDDRDLAIKHHHTFKIFDECITKAIRRGNNNASTEDLFKIVRKARIESMNILEQRDNNFCYGPLGIVNFAKGPGRIYQMVGVGHIVANNIGKILRKEDISYAAMVPVKLKYEYR